ncbi:hypothetical protein E4U55_005135 [Claviceps digitariae]|nr:hypothetical protein E4U55_005135 [Claviceps digitariae]
MSYSLLTTALLLMSCAGLARCIDVPVNLYTSTDCKTVSSITPSTAFNLSTCVVTPGLVSLHYENVPCASGGTVVPYLFKDTACATKQSVLDFYKTGSDFRCLSDFASGTVAAVMMSCGRGRREQPQATRTVSVGAVATGAAATSTTLASSASASGRANEQSDVKQGWKTLSHGARIGIIVAGGVVALILCVGLCLWLLKCIRPPPPPPPATAGWSHNPHDAASPYNASWNTPQTIANREAAPSHPPHQPWESPGWASTPHGTNVSAPPALLSPDAAYLHVLDNVIQAARRHAASGYLDNAASLHASDFAVGGGNALPVHILSAAFSKQDPDWKHKLGAAGELYMFEYLQSLPLPNFGLHNWKSSLRTRVAAHPGYHDIGHAHDGIADIEYFDEHGVLTEFLLARGYSAQGIQSGIRPIYRFEVKATTSTNWRTPFYMSGKQEAHIREALITTTRPAQVYILCRIFGLGSGGRTRLSIYLDPEARRREGRLRFSRNAGGEEGSWTVQPA